MTATIIHHASEENAVAALVAAIAADLSVALTRQGRASLVVSGGRTARLVLPRLAMAKLEWARVDVLVGDERWVPVDHPASNEGLPRTCWDGTPAAAARIHGLYRPGLDVLAAEPALDAALKTAFPAPFDAMFLGMGEDGHFASLFPGGRWQTLPPGRMVVADDSHRPEARMSLSAEAITGGRAGHLVVSGQGKRDALRRAAADPGMPVARLLADIPARMVFHVVDGGAHD